MGAGHYSWKRAHQYACLPPPATRAPGGQGVNPGRKHTKQADQKGLLPPPATQAPWGQVITPGIKHTKEADQKGLLPPPATRAPWGQDFTPGRKHTSRQIKEACCRRQRRGRLGGRTLLLEHDTRQADQKCQPWGGASKLKRANDFVAAAVFYSETSVGYFI